MRVKTQDYNDVTVVKLQGELDKDLSDKLENTVSDLIASARTGVVLDMSDVSFIDSKGLEHLLWARDYCSENHCQFRLACIVDNCQKILELTRLENEFDHYAELAQAVKSVA